MTPVAYTEWASPDDGQGRRLKERASAARRSDARGKEGVLSLFFDRETS